MNICIVSPHIDDALLSCGILMQRHLAAGDTVYVLNIFSAGTNSENRQKEEKQAQAKIGVKPFFLDELDAPDRSDEYKELQSLFFGPLRDAHAPFIEKIVQRITAFFAEHKIDRAFFPLAAGTHIDHRLAHEAGRRIAGIPVRFYEDRPYILWPGVLQGRMNQIGSDAALPKVTRDDMLKSVGDYHYLRAFMPPGAYRDAVLPLYFANLESPSSKKLKATPETLTATPEEIKTLYDCLHAYESQTPHIYGDYDTFVRDSLAYEKANSGAAAYIERSWKLEG